MHDLKPLLIHDLDTLQLRILADMRKRHRAGSMGVSYLKAFGAKPKGRGYPWQRRLTRLHRMQRQRKKPTAFLPPDGTRWARAHCHFPMTGRTPCGPPMRNIPMPRTPEGDKLRALCIGVFGDDVPYWKEDPQ